LSRGAPGYRFLRYYTRDQAYRRKGPPVVVLRLLAPLVVLSTLVVFASGVVLLFEGPAQRGQWLLIHKASFFVWLGLMAVHVLGHLDALPASLRTLRADIDRGSGSDGAAGRLIALAGALVGGLVLAIVLIPQFGAWTASGAFAHGGH
jgi:hypothetical protein